jgi:hypothetical protein
MNESNSPALETSMRTADDAVVQESTARHDPPSL